MRTNVDAREIAIQVLFFIQVALISILVTILLLGTAATILRPHLVTTSPFVSAVAVYFAGAYEALCLLLAVPLIVLGGLGCWINDPGMLRRFSAICSVGGLLMIPLAFLSGML